MTPVRESLWDSNYHPTHGSWTEENNVETEMPLNPLNNSCVSFSSHFLYSCYYVIKCAFFLLFVNLLFTDFSNLNI